MNLESLAHDLSVLIGLTTLLIGTFAVCRPQPMSKKFGIAVSGSALPYVVSTGSRDMFMGLTILVLFYQHAWHSLGAVSILIGGVALADFIIVRKHGDKLISLVHLSGALSTTIYGIWLLLN